MSFAVAFTATLVPATVAPLLGEVRETVGGVESEAFVTVNEKAVVCVTPPPVAVTVIVEVPTGVEIAALRLSVEVQLGEQDVGLNVAVTPDGNTDVVKESEAVAPADKLVVIVFEVEEPLPTDLLPPLLIEKLNGAAKVLAEAGVEIPELLPAPS